MEKSSSEWFGEWFDSPYYHILYKDRNLDEARLFIDNLAERLAFRPGDKLLDMGCGKGRHAIYLHRLGFEVTGIDLSPRNIAFASRFAAIYGDEKLRFRVHDMRETFSRNEFGYVLNMFTSFGYFETEEENKKSVCTAADALVKGGKLVIDFFNTGRVTSHLIPHQEKTVSGITFYLHKALLNGFVIKTIDFRHEGRNYHFKEKVKAITAEEFRQYFDYAGLRVISCFGDYMLRPFDARKSERMIFIAEK